MSVITESAYLTMTEVCELLRVSDACVTIWIRKGLIPRPLRIGNVRRWPREQFLAWLAQQQEGGHDE